MTKYLKEPFFHFLLIGSLIFIINASLEKDVSSENEIIITKDDVSRISRLYAQNWNREPDKATLEKLIDNYVTSEIYYQEALKLNLDHNDEIIKRRLKQKYEFVAQDLADIVDPSDEELQQYYDENSSDFVSEKKMSFYQYYINPDRHKNAYSVAEGLLDNLKSLDVTQLKTSGDQSHLSFLQKRRSKLDIAREFGSLFSDAVLEIEKPGWYGPVESGLGFHIIFVETIEEAQILPFDKVYETVLSEWKSDNRLLFTDRLITSLRDNYKIVRRDL